MRTESLFPGETPEVVEDQDQCPECGHSWIDDEQHHYHDCRYFLLGDEEEDDDFFETDQELSKHLKPWEYRPAA